MTMMRGKATECMGAYPDLNSAFWMAYSDPKSKPA
jgi:hypothetical protein